MVRILKYQRGKKSVGRLKSYWQNKSLLYNLAALLAAIGIAVPANLLQRVAAVSDMTPPTLVAANIESGETMDTVNTAFAGYNQSKADIHVTDDLSGNTAPRLVYTSPSGRQSATGDSVAVNGVADWVATTNFPQYAEDGVWIPTIYLEDASGNDMMYTSGQLQDMGVNLEVTLTGQGDTVSPQLVGVTRANPGALDVTNSSRAASNILHMTDNISGLGIPSLYYFSPSGNQFTQDMVCSAVAGNTATAGDYDCEATFAQHAESGVWIPDMIFTDGAGNTVHYDNAALLARGIDARVTITGTSDTTPPVVSDLSMTFANPPADNIPYGGAVITLTGVVTDDMTGIDSSTEIRYLSPSGKVAEGFIHPDSNGAFTVNVSLPQYTEGGTWLPQVHVQDGAGNSRTYSSDEVLAMNPDLAVTVGKNITETATPGGTVTSDYENDGANAANPIEASVTTPTGGPVSIVIVQSGNVTNLTNGYTFFDRQVSITAPTETAANPLTLTFMVDSSLIPDGQSANTLQITRNGVTVPSCTDQQTATPNPCVFSRVTTPDSDIEVKIHTTTASAWASGFPTQSVGYDFKGFTGTTKDYPKVNKVQAGQVVELGMKIKGVPRDVTDILATGEPTSQQVNCNTLATMGGSVAALSAENEGLTREGRNSNKFEYDWRTKNNWKNTCRVFHIQLKDGSSQKALFKFQQ